MSASALKPQEMKGLADEVRRLREHGVERDRAGEQEHGENAEREAEVADAVDEEGLDRGGVGLGLVVPEADQEVAREPDALPAEEQLRQIVGRHQHQHGEGEERQIREEARLVRIVGHVADRIEVDQRGHRRHHHQHHGGERVDAQRPVDLEIAGGDEVEDGDAGVVAVQADIDESDPGQHPGDAQQRRGDEFGRLRAGARWPALGLFVAGMGDVGMRARGRRRGVRTVLRHQRRGVVVVRRRRIGARMAAGRADQRDRAGDDGPEQRQKDDGEIHAA